MTGRHVVAIGGGHGLAMTLRAVRTYAGRITAIVATGDDGGSSGRRADSDDSHRLDGTDGKTRSPLPLEWRLPNLYLTIRSHPKKFGILTCSTAGGQRGRSCAVSLPGA